MLKIAIISPSAPPLSLGGIQASHYNLYKAFKEQGYNVVMFTHGDHGYKNHLPEDGIKRFGTPILFLKLINFFVPRLFRFHGIAFQVKDVILSQIGSYRLTSALKKYEPDIIIVPDQGSPLLSIRKPKRTRVIFVSHHNPLRFINEPLLGLHSIRDAQLAGKIELYTLKKVDAVICPSNYMRTFFLENCQFTGLVDVIPNVIDEKTIENIPPFDLHKMLGLPADAIIIYIPSAGSVYKGRNYVFEIVRRLSNVNNNRIIGFYLSGYIDPLLKHELSLLKSNAIVFAPGMTEYLKNVSYVKACSFCISPTLIENFSMAILEAIFCGLPVIAFNVGGNSDIIQDGNNGHLVDMLDIESLVGAAKQLLTNPELLIKMQDRCTKSVKGKFTSVPIIEHYEKCIRQLLKN